MPVVNGAGSMFSHRTPVLLILVQVLNGAITSANSHYNAPSNVQSECQESLNRPVRTRFGIRSLRIYYRRVTTLEQYRILWGTRIFAPRRFTRMSWNEGVMQLKAH